MILLCVWPDLDEDFLISLSISVFKGLTLVLKFLTDISKIKIATEKLEHQLP